MHATFQLTCVAFVRSTGGRIRVLLAIDRDGAPMHGGEPVLLVEHRPGADPRELRVEGPDAMEQGVLDTYVGSACRTDLARLVEDAHDEAGEFHGDRMLGRSTRLRAPGNSFDM